MGNKQMKSAGGRNKRKQRPKSTPAGFNRKKDKRSIFKNVMGGRKSKADKKKHTSPAPKNQEKQKVRDVRANSQTNPFDYTLDRFRAEERPLRILAHATNFDLSTIRKLHLVFTEVSSLDEDDGVIDKAELTKSMGIDDPSSVIASSFFRLFDRTETMEINFRNWVTTLSALSVNATLEEKIKFSFAMYDSNGDGLIDLCELSVLLKDAVMEKVLDMESFQVDQICAATFARADSDQNGLVDYHEYRKMVHQSPKFVAAFSLNIEGMMSSFRFGSHIREQALTVEEAAARMDHFRRQKPSNKTVAPIYVDDLDSVSVIEDIDNLFAT